MGHVSIEYTTIASLTFLCLYLLIWVMRRVGWVTQPGFLTLLGVLILGGLVAYTVPPFARSYGATGAIFIHYFDVYHYFLGTKYFPELGYDGLYEATVLADFEDDREGFQGRAKVRDLRTGFRKVTRNQLLEGSPRIRARFESPERWQEFKDDLAFFRTPSPAFWRTGTIQRDHGYNGTPFTTAILGTLGNYQPFDVPAFLLGVMWLDLGLILATAALIAW